MNAQTLIPIFAAIFAANAPSKACCKNAASLLQKFAACANASATEAEAAAAKMLQELLQKFLSCRSTAAEILPRKTPYGGFRNFCSNRSGAKGKEVVGR